MPLLAGRMVRSRDVVPAIKAGIEPELEGEAALRYAGFSVPFRGLPEEGFNEEWGRTWAAQMDAPIDVLPDAGHFLQFTHGPEIVEHIARRAND